MSANGDCLASEAVNFGLPVYSNGLLSDSLYDNIFIYHNAQLE